MKKTIFFFVLLSTFLSQGQSVISTINSGSIIVASTSASIGEMIVVPETPNLSSHSGIIGILVELKDQTLTVPEYDLTSEIKVYPNATKDKIYFETKLDIQNQNISVYNNSGQLLLQTKLGSDKTLDLEGLSNGIYAVRLGDKKATTFKIIKR
jgi:hypothetical protein